jgi:hypothetical protein
VKKENAAYPRRISRMAGYGGVGRRWRIKTAAALCLLRLAARAKTQMDERTHENGGRESPFVHH